MDVNTLRIVVTLLSFGAFLAIVGWALSRRRQAAFDAAARLPFLDDAVEARNHAGESIERGREYVAAYVRFMHYAERLHSDALSEARHAVHAAAPTLEAHRH